MATKINAPQYGSPFLTAHSTPAVAPKKTAPVKFGPSTTGSTNSYSLVTSNVMGKNQPAPSQSSATPPMTPAKQSYVNSVGGTGTGGTAVGGAKPDLSSLLPNLQKLRDQLGSYDGGTPPASTPTPPTPPTPAPDPYERTRSAMDAYIASLQPGDDETDLQKRLNNLRISTRSGVARQEEDAIPMNFITGRQAVIENRGKEMTEPLEAELARLSGNRTALSAGEKARFEFEQSLANTDVANARDDARYADGELQMVGSDVVRIKPDGTSEVVYQGTPEVDTQIVQAGGKNVLINSKTGAVISDLGATEGALSRANSGSSSGYGSGSPELSAAAQNIIKQINLGADINELIKGNSIESQRLRNEVYAGLNAQGGYANKDNLIVQEGKTLVDEMLTGKAYKALGGYSTVLGGQFGTAYGDAMRQSQQLTSILSRDNLGLLKGAMSDADLAFIKSMSSGFEGEGIPSETYIKNRLETIQTKLDKRLSGTSMSGGGSSLPQTRVVNGTTYTLQPDGTYE